MCSTIRGFSSKYVDVNAPKMTPYRQTPTALEKHINSASGNEMQTQKPISTFSLNWMSKCFPKREELSLRTVLAVHHHHSEAERGTSRGCDRSWLRTVSNSLHDRVCRHQLGSGRVRFIFVPAREKAMQRHLNISCSLFDFRELVSIVMQSG